MLDFDEVDLKKLEDYKYLTKKNDCPIQMNDCEGCSLNDYCYIHLVELARKKKLL